MNPTSIISRPLAITSNVRSTNRVAVVADEISARAKLVSNTQQSEDAVASIRQRADASSDVLERILHRSIPPLRYGINE